MKKIDKAHRALRFVCLTCVAIIGFMSILGSGGNGGGVSSITYTGLTTPATIDEDNAEDLATGAYIGYSIGGVAMGTVQSDKNIGMAGSLSLGLGEVLRGNLVMNSASGGVAYSASECDSQKVYGDCGGSLYIYFCLDYSGYLTGYFDHSSYCSEGVTTSGRVDWSGSIDLISGSFIQESLIFKDITVSWDDYSCIRGGTISYDYTVSPTRRTMDMLHCDGSTGKVYWAKDNIMADTPLADYMDTDVISGRYYDPDYGYVDLYTEETLRIYYDEDWPSKGILVGEGEAGTAGGKTKARLTVLSSEEYQVEADTDGDGSYDWESGEMCWSGICAIGSYDTPGEARDVYVSGTYAYVADGHSGLQIIDVSDPSNPLFVGSCDSADNAGSVYVRDTYAYVADGNSGFQIIDVSNPSSPTLAGSYDTPDYADDVFINASYAYVADTGGGLQIIDISNPASPLFTGTYSTSDQARGVHIIGTYAYVRDDSAFLVIDISNPSNPSLVSSYDTPDETMDVYVTGSYAYVAVSYSGLEIIDISNPSSPSFVGSVDTPGNAEGVYVSGSYVYVADTASGLQIIMHRK